MRKTLQQKLGHVARWRKGRRRVIAWIHEDCKLLLVNASEMSGDSITELIEQAVRRAYAPTTPAAINVNGTEFVPHKSGMRQQVVRRPDEPRVPDWQM